MKEKSRLHYESPWMECIRVEAESDFMSGSVVSETKSEVVSTGQELGNSFDAGTSETGDAWIEEQWK